MTVPTDQETAIRAAALEWLDVVSDGGNLPVTRDTLANDFFFAGERFPLIDRGRGIRKPSGWDAALSIMTAFPKPGQDRPYEDDPGSDGFYRYKMRRGAHARSDNAGLRAALRNDVPLAWFFGIAPSTFVVTSPVYLIDEEPHLDQFVLAVTEGQRLVSPDSPVEAQLRQYVTALTKRRLHQRAFAGRVMIAYRERCAVCSLNHRDLLDAAHITPDSHEKGLPIVSNGLALCKIHHAAFDRNILGIRPDLVVEIRQDILQEHDGPMLRHGLQELHGRQLMEIPTRRADRPDPERLTERYTTFSSAS